MRRILSHLGMALLALPAVLVLTTLAGLINMEFVPAGRYRFVTLSAILGGASVIFLAASVLRLVKVRRGLLLTFSASFLLFSALTALLIGTLLLIFRLG